MFVIKRDPASLAWRWSSTPSFPAHSLLYHTLYQLAPVVSDCVEKKEISQRTTHSSTCLVVFRSARIPWSVRCSVQLIHDMRDRSTILLIRSFSHQLSSKSTVLRHIDENRPHQRALYFSSLFILRSLQIGIRDRAFFVWQFQFWIWCHCYKHYCRHLISVNRDTCKCQPLQFIYHPL